MCEVRGADVGGGADVRGADVRGADVRGADVRGYRGFWCDRWFQSGSGCIPTETVSYIMVEQHNITRN